MRRNGINNFILHVSQCINFNQTAGLKSLYSGLDFKVIKDFLTSPNFEEARKRFNYESGKSRAFQKQTVVLQFHITIPRSVAILHDN